MMKGSMKLTLFCVIFSALTKANADAIECGPDQYYSNCGTNCPANCGNISPTSCNFACNFDQYCFCKPGYVERSGTDKTCVPWESCPQYQCGLNQYFTNCGTNCPTTCANPVPRTCNRRCNYNQHCFCKIGYVQRSETDLTCIPVGSCPGSQCGPNQFFTHCGTNCPATCAKPYLRMCNRACNFHQHCFCKKGYVQRSETNLTCIPVGSCSENECAPNEFYTQCGTNCPATCANPNPRTCNRGCNLNRHCFCKVGYVQRSETDLTCVPVGSCQDICELAPDRGLCTGLFHMYYYNKESATCESFVYGGCQGNANRFGSYVDCMTRCSK